jgi:hypothetical protein
LLQTPVESAHGFHILFPHGKQRLDVSRLAHRLAKSRGKFTRLIKARFIGPRRRAHDPWTDCRRIPSTAHFADTDLLTIVKRKSKGIAKGGESTFGCIGFSAFECESSFALSWRTCVSLSAIT